LVVVWEWWGRVVELTSVCIRLLTTSVWAEKSTAKSFLVLSVKIQRYRPRIMVKMAQTTAR
jgi:hypothetical protein